ncbi:MAG: TrpB-like pyridoxal-phosphate dependent enzyme [Actinobacteria bacterium RBG_13_63_9]|nr:MAG: TrpB-like pyridoxal-phosphate dependent enzyme [Actinobacteria bacterium RBG_13_63_9]
MTIKFLLPEDRIPTAWYNLAADLPAPPPPPLHPGTLQPAGPDDLAPLFPMGLIMQEMSPERMIEIPDEVRDIYRLWRPTPLMRAARWEKALGTPAKIYYKYEGVSPAGSHKLNTAVAQAYYNKQEGITKLTTETGAGQWGSALSLACQFLGLECFVFMVKVSFFQKPYRRSMIRAWGAEVIPSPSDTTASGRAILAQDPDSPGSLGIAISEAVEVAAQRDDTHYSLGSVLSHVLLHQTVIGQEALEQLEMADVYPDYVVGCVGGGSNFAGTCFPFVGKNIKEGRKTRIIAVEPAACPSMTKGVYAFDYGDTAKLTPLVKMDTLGHTFIPPGIHAGGLRYHGMAPMMSHAYHLGLIEAQAVLQTEAFSAGISFTRSEGILPAPEANHAIAVVKQLAEQCKQSGDEKTILFNLSGHGHFDMAAYDAYLDGKLEDFAYPEEKVKEAMKNLPKI